MRRAALPLAAAVLFAAAAVDARPRPRSAASQPASARAPARTYQPPVIVVTGHRQAPLKLVLGRHAPRLELRPLERGPAAALADAVRRAPF